jgi:hypothetical protein
MAKNGAVGAEAKILIQSIQVLKEKHTAREY